MEEKKDIVAIMSVVLNIKCDVSQIFKSHPFARRPANFLFRILILISVTNLLLVNLMCG